ncbi:unnamed protein product, partial [Ectocarpus sp. 12 AP-2014]
FALTWQARLHNWLRLEKTYSLPERRRQAQGCNSPAEMGQDEAGAFQQHSYISPTPTASRASHGTPPRRRRPLEIGGAPPTYSEHMLTATRAPVCRVKEEGRGVNEPPTYSEHMFTATRAPVCRVKEEGRGVNEPPTYSEH